MQELGIILIVLAVVLFGANWYIERQRKALGDDAPPRGRRRRTGPAPEAGDDSSDFVRPRPAVAAFHVHEEEARVTFDVPYPDEGDDVLSDLLMGEAIEVVREKRHNLPITDVTAVVVLVGDGTGSGREVGRRSLETPGVLPPPSQITDILNLHTIARDPLAAEFEQPAVAVPETVAPSRTDELSPIAEVVRMPKAVATGLRAQGVDPDTVTAGELVLGVLSLFGYAVTPGTAEGVYTATRGGTTTFVMTEETAPGDYPELGDDVIRRFIVAFEQARADRGMLVSAKFAPFSIYDQERRDPRIRFITRERIQKFVDSMALG